VKIGTGAPNWPPPGGRSAAYSPPGCCQTTTAVPSGVNATRGFVVPGSPDVMSSSSVNEPPAGRTKALSVPSRMETTIAFRSESTATSASWALEQKVGGL